MANWTGEEWQSLEVKKKRATSVELAWQAKWNLASVYLDFFIHLMHPSGQCTVFIRKRPNLGGHWVKRPSYIPQVHLPASVRADNGATCGQPQCAAIIEPESR